jgi:predicted ATPase
MAEPGDEVESETEARASRRLTLPLSSMFLDPNSYRLRDHVDWRLVKEDDLFNVRVQRDTERLVLGPRAESVRDLTDSFTQSGWLDISPVTVKQLGSRSLAVDGNRRVAALKVLQEEHARGGDIGKLDPTIFGHLPAVLYNEADPIGGRVMLALRHISGERRWSALGRARFLKALRDEHHQEPDQIWKAVGISELEFSVTVEALALCEKYQRSDYAGQFEPGKFVLFQEVLKHPELRQWIGWDDSAEVAQNTANLNRLFSWCSRDVAADDEERDLYDAQQPLALATGPAITNSFELRTLARHIGSPDFVRRLDVTRNLSTAVMSVSPERRSSVWRNISTVRWEIKKLVWHAPEMSRGELDLLMSLRYQLDQVLSSRGRRAADASMSITPVDPYHQPAQTHFSDVQIQHYRGLRNLHLESPKRVNLVAGVNNVGKTSVLEALHILTAQCDARSFLDITRRRTHRERLPKGEWLFRLLPDEGDLRGSFDGKEAEVIWHKSTEPQDERVDRATFVGTLELSAAYGANRHTARVVVSTEGRPSLFAPPQARVLCRSELTSPFSLSEADTLSRANELSVELDTKAEVLAFIREHMRPQLEGVELVNRQGRFVVNEAGQRPLDLTQYGEGMQRIFLLGTLMGLAKDGVFLIDEFENAVHTSLLKPLARMIHGLAHRLNVQVFLTTHSQEAIEAWTEPEVAGDVVGYGLQDGKPPMRVDGHRLGRLIELVGLDLRIPS